MTRFNTKEPLLKQLAEQGLEFDQKLQRALDERTAGFFIERPLPALVRAAVAHAAQTDARYFHPCGAKSYVFHCFLLSNNPFIY
jgi:hypothetical protein